MRTKFKNILYIGSFQTVFLFSCKQYPHDFLNNKYNPRLIPKAASSYHYSIISETISTVELYGKDVENKNTSKIDLVYDLLPSSDSNTTIKITFDKFHLASKTPDGETDLDADNAVNSIDPVEQFLGKIKGSSTTAVINKTGEVTSTNNGKNFIDSLLNTLSFPEEEMRTQLKEQLSQLIGQDFIKNNFQSFQIFPDSAVSEGNSWTRRNSTSASNMTLIGTTKYTLKMVSDTIAKIIAVSDINNVVNNDNTLGTNINADLKGKQEGEFEVDKQTGLLLNGETTISIKGNMQVMGRDVPVTIKIKRKVVGKKI